MTFLNVASMAGLLTLVI